MDEEQQNQPESPTKAQEKQSSSESFLIAVVVIAIVIAALGYLWYKTQNSQKPLDQTQITPTTNNQSPVESTGEATPQAPNPKKSPTPAATTNSTQQTTPNQQVPQPPMRNTTSEY